ncbi:MAG: BON domain-containing protein [Thermoanaerobaculia bacterium]
MKKSFTPVLAAALSVPVLAAAFCVTWLISALPAKAATKPKPMSKEVSEAFEATSVKARLIDKLGADALGISVSVSEKTATLTGEVTKSASQGLAEQVALSVKGIKKVDNKVEVKEPAGPVAASEASVKNVALEMKVKSILLTKIGTDALKIEVEAVDGVVSLRGKLDNLASSKVAIQKTRSIKGVRKVVDLLG